MDINIEQLKKKIIYRSSYRGTKEMDKLLGSFTKEYIDKVSSQPNSTPSSHRDTFLTQIQTQIYVYKNRRRISNLRLSSASPTRLPLSHTFYKQCIFVN